MRGWRPGVRPGLLVLPADLWLLRAFSSFCGFASWPVSCACFVLFVLPVPLVQVPLCAFCRWPLLSTLCGDRLILLVLRASPGYFTLPDEYRLSVPLVRCALDLLRFADTFRSPFLPAFYERERQPRLILRWCERELGFFRCAAAAGCATGPRCDRQPRLLRRREPAGWLPRAFAAAFVGMGTGWLAGRAAPELAAAAGFAA